MTASKQKIKTLLESFLKESGKVPEPANDQEIESFKKMAKDINIPDKAVNQLVEFYEISNGIPCVNSFSFHSCNDKILYEWWDHRQLWLAQKDSDIIRWSNNMFCLGDASNISYDKEYEFSNLADLLEKAFDEWGYR